MDLSSLSDADLNLLAKGDMRGLSDQALQHIARGGVSEPAPSIESALSSMGIPGMGGGDKDMREIALALARHLFLPKPVQREADFAKGTVQGLARIPAGPDASSDEALGNTVGRAALPAAGALAAGAATAGAGLIPAAIASGAGAAGGNTISQGIAAAAGGELPDTLGEAALESGKVGLAAAATELGVGGLLKGAAWATPKFVSAFKTFPKESLKRLLNRPDQVFSVIKGVKPEAAQLSAELKAGAALKRVQEAVVAARKTAGESVESALEGFSTATKGQKVIDANAIAQAGEDALAARSAASGATPISDAEVSHIQGLIQGLRQEGSLTARDAVIWRRKLDAALNYGKGKPPIVSSSDGSGVISDMASAMRQSIGEAAESAGYKPLAEANANFGRIASGYDAIRPSIITKNMSPREVIRRIESLANEYHKGGLSQTGLTEIGDALPGVKGAMDDLLDAIAARSLTLESKGSPSSTLMTAIRFMAGPDGFATAGRGLAKTPTKGIRRGAGVLAAGGMGATRK